MPETIAVTGATGFVGRHVCRTLASRGYAVRALVRDRDKARASIPANESISWVYGDITDKRALSELVSNANAVVHTIGIRRELPPDVTFAKLHPGATRHAIEAAINADVPRFIHISALGTRPDAPSAYHQSKYASEQILRASGLDWTILRPSLIHGPGGELMKMIKDWVLGRAAPYFVLPYFARIEKPAGFPPVPKLVSAKIQPIHVDDVAAAVALALENPATIGEVYPLAGPETFDWPTMLIAVRDALPMTEAKKKPRPIPAPLAANLARAAALIGLGSMLPFGPSEPIMASEDNTARTDKARAHLGLRPKPFLATLRAYAGQI